MSNPICLPALCLNVVVGASQPGEVESNELGENSDIFRKYIRCGGLDISEYVLSTGSRMYNHEQKNPALSSQRMSKSISQGNFPHD